MMASRDTNSFTTASKLCVCGPVIIGLPAAAGSRLVLATVGGSPGWLLGPLRVAGLSAADGRLAGPLFYAGLWLALLLYVVVLVRARDLPARSVRWVIAGLHLLFLLAPVGLGSALVDGVPAHRVAEDVEALVHRLQRRLGRLIGELDSVEHV